MNVHTSMGRGFDVASKREIHAEDYMVKTSICDVCDNCLLLIGLEYFVVLVRLRYSVLRNQIRNPTFFSHLENHGSSYGAET